MVNRRQRGVFQKRTDKVIEWNKLPGAPRYAIPQRHGFDQGEIEAIGGAIFRHWRNFIVIHAFQCDHIDPNAQSIGLSDLNPVQNLVKVTAASDGTELSRDKTVEADIDATHT